MSGASGQIYGVRLLHILKALGIETHLVMSQMAREILELETGLTVKDVESTADHVHHTMDAGPASGTFRRDGMIIAPCSVKTVSALASSYTDTLLTRAADCTIKEGKKLVLVVRETPLHSIHLKNMLTLSKAGVVILPPAPAFYNKPDTIDDIIDHTVGKVMDQFDIEHDLYERWGEK